VLEAMLPYMREVYGNPSAIHAFGRKASRAAVEQARRTVAERCTACRARSSSPAAAPRRTTWPWPAVCATGGEHVITSPIEHHAIEHVAHAWERSGPVQVHWVRLLPTAAPTWPTWRSC
jgi:cysteine desulfurase